jgi:hypothetical protein
MTKHPSTPLFRGEGTCHPELVEGRKEFMREKIIQIDGKDIAVRELKTDMVCDLFDTPEGTQLLFDLIMGNPSNVKKLMRHSIDVPDAEFENLTEGINGFAVLDQAFREVNSDFFASLPGKVDGILQLGEVAAKKIGVSLKSLASLSKKGT